MSSKETVTITPKREREEGPPVSASGCALPIQAGGTKLADIHQPSSPAPYTRYAAQARPIIVGFEPISSDSDDDGIEQADDDESEQEEQGSQEGTADPDLPKGWIKVILLDGVLYLKRGDFLDLPLSLRSKMGGSGARRSLDEVKDTLLAILLWRREGKCAYTVALDHSSTSERDVL